MSEQPAPPVEAILTEVLTLRAFVRWLERTDRRGSHFAESWLYHYLTPYLTPERGCVYRCTVVLPSTFIIDDLFYPTPDWVRSWCYRWMRRTLTAREAINTLLYGTTTRPWHTMTRRG